MYIYLLKMKFLNFGEATTPPYTLGSTLALQKKEVIIIKIK